MGGVGWSFSLEWNHGWSWVELQSGMESWVELGGASVWMEIHVKNWKSNNFTMKNSQVYNYWKSLTVIQSCWYNIIGKPVMENLM